MSQPFIPRVYQDLGITHLLTQKRAGLFAGMGLGKTISVLTAIDILHLSGEESKPALVLAPLRVARGVWTKEAAKWHHTAGMPISTIIGDAKARRAALKRDAQLFTVNYENIQWLMNELDGAWPFGTVIADESTRLKGFRLKQGGARAQALAAIAHKHATRWINLTGTPAPNGLKDLWGQTWFLDGGARLGRTYSAFQERWFQAVPGGDGYSQIRPLKFAQDEIQAKIADICLSINGKDYFSIAEPIVTPIYVDLPDDVRPIYKRMEDDMFAQIGDTDVEAFNAAARTNKCLQLANGAIYVDDQGNWIGVHSAKIEALESIIEEAAGMPVLVAYHFKSDLVRLLNAFPKGRVCDTQKDEDDWNAGKIPVMFMHPASAGHGLNLQDGGNIIVYFGHSWDLELTQQILERIGPVRQLQSGYDRPVYVYKIIARDTVDEDVIARTDAKESVQSALMKALDRRKAA